MKTKAQKHIGLANDLCECGNVKHKAKPFCSKCRKRKNKYPDYCYNPKDKEYKF
jgi:hypothetical protein